VVEDMVIEVRGAAGLEGKSATHGGLQHRHSSSSHQVDTVSTFCAVAAQVEARVCAPALLLYG
jgi:hypothetical protein